MFCISAARSSTAVPKRQSLVPKLAALADWHAFVIVTPPRQLSYLSRQ
jgi:hypothetical protein